MDIATLKALTWGTVAAAIVSAVLIAFTGGAVQRSGGETVRTGTEATASALATARRGAAPGDASTAAASQRGHASR